MERNISKFRIAITALIIAIHISTIACTQSCYDPLASQMPLRTTFGDIEDSKDTILVHIVPHSYNLEFFTMIDTYFPSKHADLLEDHYEKVFDNVIPSLLSNTERTFTHYETKLFAGWYFKQDWQYQYQIKSLVWEGRLEFVNGAWDMYDETCPTYQDMILNLQKGHHFLMTEFNYKPRVAWGIEQSGHSATHPRVLAEAGIEALFMLHINPEDRYKRLFNKEMEFLWRPHFRHLGKKAQIFSHIIYDFETSPFELLIDNSTDKPEPVPPRNDTDHPRNSDQDDLIEPDNYYTMRKLSAVPTHTNKVVKFRSYIKEMSKFYKSRNLLMLVGSNINFEKADFYMNQLNRTITEFNLFNNDIKMSFSSLNTYDRMIGKEEIEFPSCYSDMIPLTDNSLDYFTGLFTSRPTLKTSIRKGSSVIHASNKLFLGKTIDVRQSNDELNTVLNAQSQISDIIASSQSSDVVNGICRSGLENQIQNRIKETVDEVSFRLGQVINYYAGVIAGIETKSKQWEWCSYTIETNNLLCPTFKHFSSQQRNIMISLFNPSMQEVKIVKIPVPHANYQVQFFNLTSLQFEDITNPNSTVVICDPENENATEESSYSEKKRDCLLYIEYSITGQQIGFIQLTKSSQANLEILISTDTSKSRIENNLQYIQIKKEKPQTSEDEEPIEESKSEVMFLLQKRQYMKTYHFGFELRYYNSYQGFEGSRSGAAIFKPDSNLSLPYTNLTSVYYHQSEMVSQMTLKFSDENCMNNVTVRVRMYKDDPMIEWDVDMKGIEGVEKERQGKEVTVNWRSVEINDNAGKFYTDQNGLQMEERITNHRSTFNYTIKSPFNVSDNYYPVSSAIAIRDSTKKQQMTVMTTRTQGGSVLQPGRIELMHHRRLFYDDKAAKEIILNELDTNGNPISVRSTYYLQIFDRRHEKSQQRSRQIIIDNPVQQFFNFEFWKNTALIKYDSQPLSNVTELENQGLPPLAKIELIPFNKTLFYVRIENLDDEFDYDDIPDRIKIYYVDIQKLGLHLIHQIYGRPLDSFDMRIVETSITGNQDYREMLTQKTNWQAADDDYIDYSGFPVDKSKTVISLEAQRIRTFSINLKAPHILPFNDLLGPII